MGCGNGCSCGSFCRRLFCRKQQNAESDVIEEITPDLVTELAEAIDVTFTQTLPEPLSIGSHIVCTGTPTEETQRFAIDVGCGDAESGRGDIAVHFNPRFPQQCVVRNTRRHEKWGTQETTSFRMFPFKVGQTFTIEMLVAENETLCAVDGQHYCEYSHRNPNPFVASWVQVTGLRDATLQILRADVYPALAPTPPEVPMKTFVDEPAQGEPMWRPNVIATLLNGIPEGHQLVVDGRLRPWLHSFAIDVMDCAREWPRPNVLMHTNVRAHVDSQLGAQLVVLNAWLGAWGPERRQRTAKLVPGTRTIFRIVRGPAEWSVFADDVLIGELEYRASPEGARAVKVKGDLYPERIYICPATSSPQEDSRNIS